MASKLIKCTRVVTYLPSLRSAVIKCRTLSSVSPTSSFQVSESESPTAFPDQLLGPLNSSDRRLSLPSNAGLCSMSDLNPDITINSLNSPVFHSEILLPPLPFLRYSESECLFSAEVDVDFVDMSVSFPAPSDKMEYRAHSCPVLLRREFQDLFPDRDIMEGNLTVVTLSLKTENDMTVWSQKVEQEREDLLEVFFQGALEICQAFEKSGYWADFIDPSSGKPFKGAHTNFTLFETDERYRRLGFEIQDLGCCKVINHPVWGSHAYIGCLFTTAPLDHPLIVNLHEFS